MAKYMLLLAMTCSPLAASPEDALIETFGRARRHCIAYELSLADTALSDSLQCVYRMNLQVFHDRAYVPAVAKAGKMVCEKADQRLLGSLLSAMSVDTSIADEIPVMTLARIFVCQPSLLCTAYLELDSLERKTILSRLEAGFCTLAFELKLTRPSYDSLKYRLGRMGTTTLDCLYEPVERK